MPPAKKPTRAEIPISPSPALDIKLLLSIVLENKMDVKKVSEVLKLRGIEVKFAIKVFETAFSNKIKVCQQLQYVTFFEKLRCSIDVVYFMKKYVKIQNQDRGIILFDTYKFQDETIKQLQEHDRNIILKSRQMGISTLVAAYSLWMMTFNEGKNILVLSTRENTAKEIVSKVQLAWENLPSWLKLEALEKPALSLKLSNNSRILAASSAADAARSFSASILILDECAFISGISEIWSAAQPTLAANKGAAILLSTPCGSGGFFHKMWIDSEKDENQFNRIKLPWHLHPERDQAWRDRQTKDLGEKMAAQECDCSFITSGNTVVDMEIIENYKTTKVVEPVQKRGFDGNYWLWEYPNYNKGYIVSCDVATGDGRDYSAFQVIDNESVTQVAEYVGKIPPKEFGQMAMAAAVEWNNALLIIEREGPGMAAIQPALDSQYPNLFYSAAGGPELYVDVQHQVINKYYADNRNLKPGFNNNMRTRPLIVSKLEDYFRGGHINAKSSRLIEELAVFIWDNSRKPCAMEGYNDDLVMSMCIALWARDTALRLRTEGIELVRTLLGGITRTAPTVMPIMSAKTQKGGFSQWNMRGPRGEAESLEWLLK
jgi:hypothetical protein